MKKLILLLLLVMPACATTSDVAMLKAEINQLKKENYDIKTGLTGVAKEDSLSGLRESGASLRSELSGISKDLQTLTGRFDEHKYFMDKSLKDKSSEIEFLKTQIIALETQIKDLQPKSSSKSDIDSKTKGKPDIKKDKKTETEEAPAAEVKDPAKLYEKAYNAFKDKKYKESREGFEAFLKEFPKDKLADNAQFWAAETYYAEEDYASAIVEYDALLKNYPKSAKAPAALLKQGYAFVELGDKKAAKGIFEQLRTKFPKSKEADLAKKKLDAISKKGK